MDSKLLGANCNECPLKDCKVVPPRGRLGADVVFVGESPGKQELLRGAPFVGDSGQLLNDFVTKYPNVIVRYTNLVMCSPSEGKVPDELMNQAIECCWPRLMIELGHQPRVVALGNWAARHLVEDRAMVLIRGAWYEKPWGLTMATWHPAYILREPNDAIEFFADLKKALLGRRRGLSLPKVVYINNVLELRAALDRVGAGKWVAFDVEASQVDWKRDRLLMLGLNWGDEYSLIIHPAVVADPAGKVALTEFFAFHKMIGHNAKFDEHWLRGRYGIQIDTSFDTMLAHYAMDERKGGHGLKRLAREYFDIRDYDHELVHSYLRSRSDDWGKVPYESLAQYLAWDCAITYALREVMEAELRAKGLYEWPFMNVLMKLHYAVARMEELGMMVDVHLLELVDARLELEEDKYLEELREMSGHPELNPRSPKQLQVIIWGERHLVHPDVTKYDKVKGQVNVNPNSTSAIALNHLAVYENGEVVGYTDDFLNLLFKYRRVAKIRSTYVRRFLEKRDENDRFHDDIKIIGTETGRLATFLHTIPRDTADVYGLLMRACFVAPVGYKFARVDFSQAELRAAGAVSRDSFIIETYKSGVDLHSQVTEAVFGSKDELGERKWKEVRVIIKRLNFAFLYGGGMSALTSDATIPPARRMEFKNKYESKMLGLMKWKTEQIAALHRRGYIQTPFGRRRRFPFLNNVNRKEAEKAAVNVPIQSTPSDITGLAACQLVLEGYRVLMTKHDEVLAEVPIEECDKHCEHIKDVMETIAAQYFPEIVWKADIELADRWTELPESLLNELELIGQTQASAS